ncbi:hypothetical protein [Azospirillum brasilense]|uniref:hypothetical protein n=1 Tax=Azospirillum brasilense TaxID=192 RepID=UPI001EDC17A3|nr:hypothetical protein [Azospirillum brasilense]UKJ74253.1 hypothetical protein H1Q64_06620 [Azospirillum brasilense]
MRQPDSDERHLERKGLKLPNIKAATRNVHRPTVQQQIHGVVQELEALPQHPTADQVRACIDRLTAICNRIEGRA